MSRRGRPRYPDILTPREWEVLELLRRGLSNGQIADRLGIRERTAKFHVSEILGKLGVESREEAATWCPEERKRSWSVAFQWPVKWSIAAKIAGATFVVATAAGIGVLAWGVLTTDSPPFDNATDTAGHTEEPVAIQDEDGVIIVEPLDDGRCEVLYIGNGFELIDARFVPCEDQEGGGRACWTEGHPDTIGDIPSQVIFTSCGSPSHGEVKYYCTRTECMAWSAAFFDP
jgi:DNA-binding CsgD family transcriptional regulator